MSEKKGIFLTGASGFLGGNIIETILENSPDVPIYNLVRSENSLKAIRDRFYWASDRLHFVSGNITHEGVISPDSAIGPEELSDKVDCLIHSAANVKFSAPSEELSRDNVDGVKNVLSLATKLKNLRQFSHISTAYVNPIEDSVNNTGRIFYEDGLIERSSFGSGYEKSKWLGEQVVRQARDKCALGGTRIDIFRPSIIVGDSRDGGPSGGRDMTFNSYLSAIYQSILKIHFNDDSEALLEEWQKALQVRKNGAQYNPELNVRLIGHLSTLKSFIWVDEVARRINYLSQRDDSKQGAFHITGKPIHGGDIERTINRIFPFARFEYVGDKVNEPTTVERVANIATRAFRYYTTHTDLFDTSNAHQHLARQGYVSQDMTPGRFTSVISNFVRRDLIGPIAFAHLLR